MTHRDEIEPEAKQLERSLPTRHKTERNRFEMPCGECGQAFFVDEETAERVQEQTTFDPAENPFRCPECEAEYGDEEYGR